MSSNKREAMFTQGTSDGFAVQPSSRSQTSRILLHGNCYQGNEPAAAQRHPIVVWASEPFGLEREMTNMTPASVHARGTRMWVSWQRILRKSYQEQEDRELMSYQLRRNAPKPDIISFKKEK